MAGQGGEVTWTRWVFAVVAIVVVLSMVLTTIRP
jgi:hypothetical protein